MLLDISRVLVYDRDNPLPSLQTLPDDYLVLQVSNSSDTIHSLQGPNSDFAQIAVFDKPPLFYRNYLTFLEVSIIIKKI